MNSDLARGWEPRVPASFGKAHPPAQVEAWLIIQPGRYRHSVDWPTGIDAGMVIGEYLACRVVWSR